MHGKRESENVMKESFVLTVVEFGKINVKMTNNRNRVDATKMNFRVDFIE
jgi:hypothetical protein